MAGNREDIEIINLTNKRKFWNPEIIKFQSDIREVLKDSLNKQFNITCGNFVVGESEDSVHGYDFTVSVEKGGKKGILLVSVMHKWKDGPTSAAFTDWSSAVAKLLSKKELINIIAVIPMGMGKPYIEKLEKDKIIIMPIDKFKEEIIREYKPWKPELLERWEQDEIYLRPIKYVGNKAVQNNPWIKDYQKLLKEMLEESKSYNGRPKAPGGYDLISKIKGKEILIEAKGKTWINGPPSLLLNIWLKSVKNNFLLQAENKDIHEVIGVVPLGGNIWRFPSASKNIQMMSLEQFANYIANRKNKPELLNEWKDRISKILREMELHTIEDPPTEPKQHERGKLAIEELEKDTFEIGIFEGRPYIRINRKRFFDVDERIFADLVYLAAAKKYRRGEEQWVAHTELRIKGKPSQELSDIRDCLQRGIYNNEDTNRLDLLQPGKYAKRKGQVLLFFSPEDITIDKSICDFESSYKQGIEKVISSIYYKWKANDSNIVKKQLAKNLLESCDNDEQQFTDNYNLMFRHTTLVTDAAKIMKYKFQNNEFETAWGILIDRCNELIKALQPCSFQ